MKRFKSVFSRKNKKSPAERQEPIIKNSSTKSITTKPAQSNMLTLSEIKQFSTEQLKLALKPVDDEEWGLFATEGEMKLYKQEKEIDGIICDPLRALHLVKGVTAREFIDMFFDPNLKVVKDDNIVRSVTVDKLNEDTIIRHLVHKRIWPAAQRECLFWSHKMEIPKEDLDPDAIDGFMVCNKDCERDDVPLVDTSNIRISITITMTCQTLIDNSSKSLGELDRSEVSCRVDYTAQINPRGWLPKSLFRQAYKREYPKFLRLFVAHAIKECKDKPLNL